MTHDLPALTENAAKRLVFLAQKQQTPGLALRLRVDSGGCSGFQYHFSLQSDAPAAEDTVVEKAGAVLRVDAVSLAFVAGAEIDFVSDLSGERFTVKNPQADSACGCGVSFAVKI